MWVKRLAVGSGLALASLVVVPGVAGAAGVYTGVTPPTVVATVDGPAPSSLPFSDGSTPGASAPVATTAADGTTSSLPFTGADVEGLAVAGAGAVLAGGLLLRRRRSHA